MFGYTFVDEDNSATTFDGVIMYIWLIASFSTLGFLIWNSSQRRRNSMRTHTAKFSK